MIKNFILTTIISIFLVTNSHSAGSSSSSGDGGSMKSNYEKPYHILRVQKNLKKKEKQKKQIRNMKKHKSFY